jgi:tryptophan 2,3-dioxygenase
MEESYAESDVHYSEYLQLDKILSAQRLLSGQKGEPVHDEHLFIIVHQTYELWFKQLLYELDYIMDVFRESFIKERELLRVILRLHRILKIFKLLIREIAILETMTSLDFMEFRDLLMPASGFQSVQFRLLENKLGLSCDRRPMLQQKVYTSYFKCEEAEMLSVSEQGPSLVQLLEQWLERTPGILTDQFDFVKEYTEAVHEMLKDNRKNAEMRRKDDPSLADVMMKEHDRNFSAFESIFHPAHHAKLVASGNRRLSHKAFMGVLMINIYR